MKKILDLNGTMEHAPLMSNAEIAAIIDVVMLDVPEGGLIVELGCYAGGTTQYLATVAPKSKIVAVEGFYINGEVIRDFVINKRFPHYPNIELLEMSTDEAAKVFTDPIDFLFIDADHQKDSIERDCVNWLPKVKSGGIVVFDDYANDDFRWVGPTVDAATKDWETIDQVETIIIKRKL